MQLCISLPAVLLWGQPHEEKKDEEEDENEKTEFVQDKNENNNNNVEQVENDSYNMCLDICFWAWLFGTTAWSLGKPTVLCSVKLIDLDFVIPLDFAIQFMTENGIDRNQAGAVMSAFGITELVSRIVCAVTGEQKLVSFVLINFSPTDSNLDQ